MSRCFPFPPPGYDKIATHETDPLIKEKHKEKKHKNDKDKEKKSKDRSRDKHKERKEKHKERKDKEKDKEKCKPLEEKEAEALTNTGHREKLVTNTVQNNSNGESKYVQELARRIRHDEEATGSQSAQKITNQKVQVTNDRDNDDKRINTQRNFTVARSSENAVARASFGADQRRTVAMGKPMENRDKARHTESPHSKENVTMSDKPRDKEGVKKHVAKDTDRNKEKKTVSVNKTHKEKPKLIEGPKLEERGKDSLDIMNGRPPDMSRGSVNSLIAEKSLGKRMDLDTNGLLYENGTKPNKLQRHSASVSSVENGRTLGPHRSPASEMQGTTCKPEVKEVKINGFAVSGEKEKALSLSPLAARVKVKENGEAPPKPPHPDLKYLDHILSVPKRELFLEVDNDEEWLYGPLGVKLKKARTYYPDSGESLQVWNQAFEIESADISALPYVVPF